MTREDCLYCVEKEKSNNVSTSGKWAHSRLDFKNSPSVGNSIKNPSIGVIE